MFIIETDIPSDNQAIFRLGFLEFLVVVRFHLNKRAEDILVLVWIFVLEKDRKGIVVYAGSLLQVCNGGIGVVLPHLFQLGDLWGGEVSSAELLGVGGC